MAAEMHHNQNMKVRPILHTVSWIEMMKKCSQRPGMPCPLPI